MAPPFPPDLERVPFSVAILAGGAGRRLGREKASVEVAGRPLLQWTAAAVGPLTDDLLVAGRAGQALPEAPPGIRWRVVEDATPGLGPLGGIAAGLAAARHPWLAVVAVDQPLVISALLDLLAARAAGWDAVAAEVSGWLQPLPALYGRGCAAAAQALLAGEGGGARDLLRAVRTWRVPEATVRQVDPALRSFLNCNRPEDLPSLEAALRDEGR